MKRMVGIMERASAWRQFAVLLLIVAVGTGIAILSQRLVLLFAVIVPGVVSALLFSRNPLAYLSLNRTPRLLTAVLVVVASATLYVSLACFFQFVWWQLFPPLPESVPVYGANSVGGTETLLSLLVFSCVGEEILMRGTCQNVLRRLVGNEHLTIVIVSLLFAVAHGSLPELPQKFLTGLFFGYLLYSTGSLWMPILAHFTMNGIALLLTESRIARMLLDIDLCSGAAGYWAKFLLITTVALGSTWLLVVKKM